MATERKVVDFKIHNLTEEQFQELKAQGKIDPNAVYCTPDTTKERLDALENEVTGLNSSISTVDSNAVHKTGNETIDGSKTFLRAPIHKISVDSTTTPSAYIEDIAIESQDINNKLMSSLRTGRGADGGVQSILYARKNNTDGTNVTANLKVAVDGNGNPYFQVSSSPAASDNSTRIATTAWVRDLFETLYPVGSLYISTGNSCPLTSIVKKSDGSNSTWALVAAGKALWTGNGTSGSGTTENANFANAAANTTIAAGTPNITGTVQVGNATAAVTSATGAFKATTSGTTKDVDGSSRTANTKIALDASGVSSIYGNSTTVQPPAYVVNVWRRTA